MYMYVTYVYVLRISIKYMYMTTCTCIINCTSIDIQVIQQFLNLYLGTFLQVTNMGYVYLASHEFHKMA